MLVKSMDNFLPTKTIKICPEDRAWFKNKLTKLDRRCKREYAKSKKSDKWNDLYQSFLEKCSKEKEKYRKILFKI